MACVAFWRNFLTSTLFTPQNKDTKSTEIVNRNILLPDHVRNLALNFWLNYNIFIAKVTFLFLTTAAFYFYGNLLCNFN